MDPPTLINDNSGAYNFSEIWPLPINGAAQSNADVRLELRRPPFVADLSHFAIEAANPQVSMGGGEPSHRGGAGASARRRRDASEEEEEESKSVSTSSANANANAVNGSDGKRLKTSGSAADHENQDSKADGEGNSGKGVEQGGSKSQPEPPKDYIHVRARRGQATDSHSLAERARREKISDRMKILQDLVPGCNKVIGKALVLDEIINYIQSLQRQVEFLSMKLEAVNSRTNLGMEGYPSKDFVQPGGFDSSAVSAYGSQAPREYDRGSSPEWLHMQVGSGFERQT